MRLAKVVLIAVALFAIAVLAWVFVATWNANDEFWPPLPGRGLRAFAVYGWGMPLLLVFAAVVTVAAGVRRDCVRVLLPVGTCVGVAIVYAPLGFLTVPRVDRVLGPVEEPVMAARGLAIGVAITFAMLALHVIATRGSAGALVVTGTLSGVMLHFFVLFVVMPLSPRWFPYDAYTYVPELPARSCRGALLWKIDGRRVRPVGYIDDVWLNREGGWAVSAEGAWTNGYFWLDRSQFARLRVRADDPNVIRCDDRPRPEPVKPAPWHRLGAGD